MRKFFLITLTYLLFFSIGCKKTIETVPRYFGKYTLYDSSCYDSNNISLYPLTGLCEIKSANLASITLYYKGKILLIKDVGYLPTSAKNSNALILYNAQSTERTGEIDIDKNTCWFQLKNIESLQNYKISFIASFSK